MHLKLGMEIQTHEKSYHSSRIRFTVMFRDRYLVTGNQIEEDKARFDPSLETFDKEILRRYIDKANELFRIDVPVIWYELSRGSRASFLAVNGLLFRVLLKPKKE